MTAYAYTTERVHNLTDADRFESRPASQSFADDEFEPAPAPAFSEFMPPWAIARAIAYDEGRRFSIPVFKLTAGRAITYYAAPSGPTAYRIAVAEGWAVGKGTITVELDAEPMLTAGYLSKEEHSDVVAEPLTADSPVDEPETIEAAPQAPSIVEAPAQEAEPADPLELCRQLAAAEAERHEGWTVHHVECGGEVLYAAGRDPSHALRMLVRDGWKAPAAVVRVTPDWSPTPFTLDSRTIFGFPWDRPHAA